jgi:3-dehydroquinate dehydratase
MKIEVSIGEIVDKLTILEIKKENIKDENKLVDIVKEYNYLKDIVVNEIGFSIESDEYIDLLNTNKKLWNIENHIRNKEKRKSFDVEFIELARNVYFTNDIRASQKKYINLKLNSEFIEHKSYSDYK